MHKIYKHIYKVPNHGECSIQNMDFGLMDIQLSKLSDLDGTAKLAAPTLYNF